MNSGETDSKVPHSAAAVRAETHLPKFSGEWETKTLEELAHINPENLSSSTNPDYEFNYIALEQVDIGRLCGHTVETFRTAPSRARRVLRRGDIIMSTVRPNLKSHLFFRDQITNAVCSTGFAVIRSNPNLSDPGFLFAHLLAHVVNSQVKKMLAGSNYPAITSRDVQTIEIPCPTEVDEQRAIAEALSDIDGLLSALDALIAKKRAIKQAAMQQLLTGKTRLPGFSGEWRPKKLADLLTYQRPDNYIVQSTEDAKHGEVPVLTANKSFVLHYTDEEFGVCSSIPVIVFDDFTTDCKYVTFPFKVKSSAIKLLYARHDRVSLRYVYERMKLIRLPVGEHKRYYISEYQNIEFLAPLYDEQVAIVSALSDMDAEIVALERRRNKTKSIKQGMMQQLLTGRVRLMNDARVVIGISVLGSTVT